MILNKDVLVNNILTELSDNSNGQISPYDIRHNLLDIVDSVHLLTIGKPLNSSNFGTPSTRSTRIGEDALSKINLAGYFSIDNTAVGYSALKSNYQGIKNTAVGSNSLFCNIYGEHNVALGYSSLGGNTVGIGNVGVGNYSLNNNKGGNFNIAIGHGAGYYLTNNTNNKLFIASHPVDSGYICNNPNGSGLTPLIYGDLSELKLGIGVNTLVNGATLQVGGNTIPSSGEIFNLGASGYRWKSLFTQTVDFDNNVYLSGISGQILSNASILPARNTDVLGSPSNLWSSGYFDNIFVNDTATFTRYVALENCNYFCKTISLASPSSGNISIDGGGPTSLFEYSHESEYEQSSCGYPSDALASGAGLLIKASGTGYLRDYYLTFLPQDGSLSCLQNDNVYSRSSWNTNISLHIASGSHLRTDRVIFPSSINIVNSNGCFGIFSRNNGLFISKQDLVSTSQNPSGYLAGVGNVNFYAPSGDMADYIVNIASSESGVNLRQRFLTGIKKKSLDALNNNKDKLIGFEFQYIDDSNATVFGPAYDRFVIGSYNNTSEPVNALTLMKSNQTEGIVCINNLNPLTKNIVPTTSLNVRSSSNAIGRFTAENSSNTISAIQLLGGQNCLYDGFEISYLNNSGIADLSIFKESGKSIFARFYENNRIGFFNGSGSANEMITIGDSFNNDAVVSMYSNSTTISSTPNYGKLYVQPKLRTKQSHSIFFMDGSGNVHDLVLNSFDSIDGRFVYTDPSGNTMAGLLSPSRRDLINGSERNTAYGYGALFSLSNADDNTVVGRMAGSGLTTGNRNVIFGADSAKNLTTGSNNIILGYNSFNTITTTGNSNIIIGSNGVGNTITGSHRFILGQSGVVLLDGILGPNNSDKLLNMPSGGKFAIYDSTNTDSLEFRANYIDVVDRGGNDYPNNSLTFRFAGNLSAELLNLNHGSSPMANTAIYQNPIQPRPFAQLNGDLRLRGSIRFSDSTSLSSANFLQTIDAVSSGLNITNNTINSILDSFVEGYVDSQIDKPSHPSNPTSGIMYTKNQFWANDGQVVLINKDPTSLVHSGAYVIAMRVNNEFRPIWISANDSSCVCCR